MLSVVGRWMVVCSCRGKKGIEGRVCQVPFWCWRGDALLVVAIAKARSTASGCILSE